MFFADLIFALAIALFLTLVVFIGLRRYGVFWHTLLSFFIIIFLAAWAGGKWLTPFGPSVWGVQWMPFFLVGIIFALLLAAAAPVRRPRSQRERMIQKKEERLFVTAFGLFFWILIVILLGAVIAGYL